MSKRPPALAGKRSRERASAGGGGGSLAAAWRAERRQRGGVGSFLSAGRWECKGIVFFCPGADLPSFFLLVCYSGGKRKGRSALQPGGQICPPQPPFFHCYRYRLLQ